MTDSATETVSFPVDADVWLHLHELRLRGRLAAEGGSAEDALVEAGHAALKNGFLVLTGAGRSAHAGWALLAAGSPEHKAAEGMYEAFLPLNHLFLQVCHDWQICPAGGSNDHSDAGYDWEVIERLERLDERAGPLVIRLGRAVPRFASYRPRLSAALARVVEGEKEWLASPRCDSYHTVWMQLHEDLLCALGLSREDEASRG